MKSFPFEHNRDNQNTQSEQVSNQSVFFMGAQEHQFLVK